jgi:hypothetical protein
LRVAQGSLKELETHVILAQRVGLLVSDTSNSLLTKSDRIGKMLRSLIRALQKRVEGKKLNMTRFPISLLAIRYSLESIS